jgi:Ca2+-binding EF-hand superfamily protein
MLAFTLGAQVESLVMGDPMDGLPSIYADDIRALQESFQLFDLNRDGVISAVELEKVLSHLGQRPSQSQVADVIATYDRNGDAQIEFGEFLFHAVKTMQFAPPGLRLAFASLDQDGDGRVGLDELQPVFGTLFGYRADAAEAERMMHRADADGDGKLSYAELVKLLMGD